jgi:hypothetical protein
MKRYIYQSGFLLSFCLLLFALPACKKYVTELPGNTASNALNFYSASDVMAAAYGTAASTATAVYVDTLKSKTAPYAAGTYDRFPVFDYSNSNWLVFPLSETGGGFLVYAYYNNRQNGHRLFFTDTAGTPMLDTLIRPAPASYTCVYLADAPNAAPNSPAVYQMVAVPEARAGVPAGKVGIRFINLSPDAGSLACSLLKADGSLTALSAGNISYGQASAYQYLDSTATSSGLVKLSLSNPANGANVLTGVAFASGRSYVVVITGFLNDQQRQVRSGTNPDGSAKYTTISITSNLRAVIRKSY